MMSDIWLRKIKTYFHVMDLEKKGVITLEAFELMAKLFSERENGSPELRDRAVKAFHDVYLKYTLSVASQPEDKRVLTESVLIESLKQLKDDPEFKKNIGEKVLSLIHIMDTNKDGYLQSDEYRRGFESLGVADSEFTKVAFEAIDTDHDGLIGPDEIIAAYLDFLLSADSPNNYFWGPLL